MRALRESPGAVQPVHALSAPDFTIGSVDGAPEYLFDRVTGAARLSDGRIVVIDGSTGQLRYYDQLGRFIRATGGKGEGPGEVVTPMGLDRMPGDTLLVCDSPRRHRFYYYIGEGSFVREVTYDRGLAVRAQLNGSMMALHFVPVRDDLVLVHGQVFGEPARAELENGANVWGGMYLHISQDTFTHVGRHRGAAAGVGLAAGALDFPAGQHYALSRDPVHVFLGDAQSHDVRVYDESAALTRIIRTSRTRVPMTATLIAEIESAMRRYVASYGGDLDELERQLPLFRYPSEYPSLLALSLASTGHLWIQRYPFLDDVDSYFDVYDPGNGESWSRRRRSWARLAVPEADRRQDRARIPATVNVFRANHLGSSHR